MAFLLKNLIYENKTKRFTNVFFYLLYFISRKIFTVIRNFAFLRNAKNGQMISYAATVRVFYCHEEYLISK